MNMTIKQHNIWENRFHARNFQQNRAENNFLIDCLLDLRLGLLNLYTWNCMFWTYFYDDSICRRENIEGNRMFPKFLQNSPNLGKLGQQAQTQCQKFEMIHFQSPPYVYKPRTK